MTQLKVSDVMSADVVAVPEDSAFRDIVSVLANRQVSAVPVVDAHGRVLGVVSEADLLHKVEFAGGEADSSSHLFERRARRIGRKKAAGDFARDLMTAPAITVPTSTSVVVAARLLESSGIKRLPVVDDLGRLVGIVARRDLLKAFLRSDEKIRDEVVREVLGGGLWLDPVQVTVEVRAGIVTLQGEVEKKSLIPIVRRLVSAVDGVVDVDDRLTYRSDDTTAAEPEFYRPLV